MNDYFYPLSFFIVEVARDYMPPLYFLAGGLANEENQ